MRSCKAERSASVKGEHEKSSWRCAGVFPIFDTVLWEILILDSITSIIQKRTIKPWFYLLYIQSLVNNQALYGASSDNQYHITACLQITGTQTADETIFYIFDHIKHSSVQLCKSVVHTCVFSLSLKLRGSVCGHFLPPPPTLLVLPPYLQCFIFPSWSRLIPLHLFVFPLTASWSILDLFFFYPVLHDYSFPCFSSLFSFSLRATVWLDSRALPLFSLNSVSILMDSDLDHLM